MARLDHTQVVGALPASRSLCKVAFIKICMLSVLGISFLSQALILVESRKKPRELFEC
jgi:hypothetical protein